MSAAANVSAGVRGWLFPPVPLARLALFRQAVYAFVILDVVLLRPAGYYHGWADPVWYEPLWMGKLLHLPAASVPLVEVLRWGSAVAALAALTGRLPRVLGAVVAVTWIWYQYVAFSYGKVDHDRADFVVALLVLPMVAGAGLYVYRRSESAGFALRAVQLTAIATYFLSAWAKLRFGGPEWVNSATMVRAVVRRGTEFGELFLQIPWSLHLLQWGLMGAELLSPVIFLVNERWRRRMVYAWYLFHAGVYATITIAFWPHLVMMLAFLPLEEYRDRLAARWRAYRAPPPEPGDRSAAGREQAGVPPGRR